MSDQDIHWIRTALVNLQALVDTLVGVTSRLDYASIKFDQAIEYLELKQDFINLSYDLGQRLPTELEVFHDTLLTILDRLDTIADDRQSRRKTGELRQNILNKRIESLRRQIEIHYQRKNYLEEQGAKYGGETPFNIFSDIIRETERISALEAELDDRLEAHRRLD